MAKDDWGGFGGDSFSLEVDSGDLRKSGVGERVRERAGKSGDEEGAGSGSSAGGGEWTVTCVAGGGPAEAISE